MVRQIINNKKACISILIDSNDLKDIFIILKLINKKTLLKKIFIILENEISILNIFLLSIFLKCKFCICINDINKSLKIKFIKFIFKILKNKIIFKSNTYSMCKYPLIIGNVNIKNKEYFWNIIDKFLENNNNNIFVFPQLPFKNSLNNELIRMGAILINDWNDINEIITH